MTRLIGVNDIDTAVAGDGGWDAVVVVTPTPDSVQHAALREAIGRYADIDAASTERVSFIPVPSLAGGRLVVAPTGQLDRDQDDVRRFRDAAGAAMTRARDAGARRPLLVVAGVPDDADFANAHAVGALSALGALWQPLEARETDDACEPVEQIGIAALGGTTSVDTEWIEAVERGKRLARDLAGTEPERMAPPRFADYCREAFAQLPVEVEVVSELDEIARDYPLLAAVARASLTVDRHQPRVVRLVYSGEGAIESTLLLAGKGVTYDTGGADIKAGGAMAGMSRDKGGAAAVAGFVHAVASLRPKGVRVIAELGAVRNSVGADAYVTDEILTSHAGVRVRVGNTDAEGRLVLADLLSHLRRRALAEQNPKLFTVATLTGHAALAVGPYSIALDNLPARQAGVANALAAAGDAWGDPFDVSRLRREDWDFVKPRSKADDVLSCNNAASSATGRGHQFPMAFLAIAAGLVDHSRRGAEKPLAYTHIDIAGSAVEGGDWQHGRPTAAPVVAMLRALI